MELNSFQDNVAKNLKIKRKEKGLSLDATAKLTQVSKAMLGQIERGESSPTIATLWKITKGLNTSFSSFFTGEENTDGRKVTFPNDENMKINAIFPFQEDSGLEVLEITLLNQHTQLSEPHSSNTIEHIYVIEGSVSVLFDEQWHHLQTGQSIRFSGAKPHGYKTSLTKAVFQNIIRYC